MLNSWRILAISINLYRTFLYEIVRHYFMNDGRLAIFISIVSQNRKEGGQWSVDPY
jgi:hypothetical protein